MSRRVWLGPILGALLAVPAASAALAAAPDTAGVSLSGDANSSPVEAVMLATTVSTTPLVDGRYPHAQADVASSVQATAHGTIFDPGALVQTLPYEINSNCPPPSPFPPLSPPGGCPSFPAYPYEYDADNGRPHNAGSVAGATYGPLTLAAGRYDLNVGSGSADAEAYGGSAALAAAAPITVANGSAHADVRVLGSQVLSTAESRVQGVVIAGVLDIGVVDSTATTSAVSGRPGSAGGMFSVSGVTLAGQPASIDQNGIHVASQTLPLPLDSVQQALQQLQQAGVTVRLLAPARQVAAGHSDYTGSAIQVTMTSPQDGSSISILLGGASSSTVAVPFQLPALAPFTGLGGTAPPPPPGGLPAAVPPSTLTTPGTGGEVILRLAGFAFTPRELLLALAGLLELALLAGAATIVWPRPAAVPQPTLRAL